MYGVDIGDETLLLRVRFFTILRRKPILKTMFVFKNILLDEIDNSTINTIFFNKAYYNPEPQK